MKIIALIPARGGSKGIPGKNIKPFAGKPLIVHTVEQALAAPQISKVYVSTDDETIAAISRDAGASVIQRPAHLAGDTASTESAVEHTLTTLDSAGNRPDCIVLLQATSPLRPEDGVARAIETFITGGFDSLVTISPSHRFFWKVHGDTAVAQYDYMHRPRRQDITPEDASYVENGSFYIFTREHFLRTGNRLGGRIGYYLFPEEYSYEIDSLADFIVLENLYLFLKRGGEA